MGVRIIVAVDCMGERGGSYPGDVDQDQPGNADSGTGQIELPELFLERHAVRGPLCWLWDDQHGRASQDHEPEAEGPEGPGPPGEREQGGKDGARDGAGRGGGAKDGKDHVLPGPVGIAGPQDGEAVGQGDGGADALEGAGKVEHDDVGIDSQAGDDGPEAEPGEADDEHALVAKEVAHAARDEDEGADGQAVGGDEPGQVAGLAEAVLLANDVHGDEGLGEPALGHELGGADDGDKGDLVGQGEARGQVGAGGGGLAGEAVFAVG